MYNQVITSLRTAYNRQAEERGASEPTLWKKQERQHFLDLLQQEGKKSLLEIGAGTGKDSKFFQENGLEVISTDLSPEMVKFCQQKGLTAHVMDFLHLDFPAGSFDAIYSLNCLLHVPTEDLPRVLSAIQSLLKSSGLFYLGLYGGREFAGVWPSDHHDPKRFFSYHTDGYMRKIVAEFFDLLYFKAIPVERDSGLHFQSMILRQR
jgi:SAM-dependent methyltransferase